MNAFILCDASYDKETRVGAIAGSTVVDGEGIRFTEFFPNLQNSHEAEMMAIDHSVREFTKRIKGKEHGITHLHIFTDSQSAINMHDHTKKEYRTFREFRGRILGKLGDKNIKLTYHKVKGHQKASEANKIEAKHNEIDKMARAELKRIKEGLFAPKKDTKFVGVVLGAGKGMKHGDSFFNLGKSIADKGLIPRVVFEGDQTENKQSHPFIRGYRAGINGASDELERQPQVIKWSKTYHNSNDPHLQCNGMDKCLINKYLQDNNRNELKFYWEREKSNRAGAVSRLLYGVMEAGLTKNSEPKKRLEDPSSLVINLGTERKLKYGIHYWLKNFSEFVDIDICHNLKDAEKALGIRVQKEKAQELTCAL